MTAKVKLETMRHHAQLKFEYDTVEEAIHQAVMDDKRDNAVAKRIVVDGVDVWNFNWPEWDGWPIAPLYELVGVER